MAILEKEPESMPSIPAPLEHVLATSLAKDPADRWQTARPCSGAALGGLEQLSGREASSYRREGQTSHLNSLDALAGATDREVRCFGKADGLPIQRGDSILPDGTGYTPGLSRAGGTGLSLSETRFFTRGWSEFRLSVQMLN